MPPYNDSIWEILSIVIITNVSITIHYFHSTCNCLHFTLFVIIINIMIIITVITLIEVVKTNALLLRAQISGLISLIFLQLD